MPEFDVRECGFKKYCEFQVPCPEKHNLCAGPTVEPGKQCALAYAIELWDLDYFTTDIRGGRLVSKIRTIISRGS